MKEQGLIELVARVYNQERWKKYNGKSDPWDQLPYWEKLHCRIEAKTILRIMRRTVHIVRTAEQLKREHGSRSI